MGKKEQEKMIELLEKLLEIMKQIKDNMGGRI